MHLIFGQRVVGEEVDQLVVVVVAEVDIDLWACSNLSVSSYGYVESVYSFLFVVFPDVNFLKCSEGINVVQYSIVNSIMVLF